MGKKSGEEGGNAARKDVRQLIGRLWDEGLASGPAAPGLSITDIKIEARRRHDQDGAAPGLR